MCANVVTARFHVPNGPIVADTTNVLPSPNLGFEFADGTASPPSISAVAVTGPDTVELTLSRASTGASPRLRYAFTAPGGAGQASLAAGNLHDSDATTGASGVPLPNWLVHFDEPAFHAIVVTRPR